MAHMYGLAFETCYPMCMGSHIHFLTRTPSPRIIAETFVKYAPVLIISVPLILEKIVKKKIYPVLNSKRFLLLSRIPFVRERIYKMIASRMSKSLGNNFYEVIIGGAALNKEVEKVLRLGHFRYTVGYGMTECGPLISYEDWNKFPAGSVGRAINGMEIKIDSPDERNVVGEILVRGENVMLGYFNNQAATNAVMSADGWLRTGDLGTLDENGYLYIRGRSKNMLLGPNGQNIYPEEIEDLLNNKAYVSESLIVTRQDKLVALIHPDLERMDVDGISSEQLQNILQTSIDELNKEIPSYSQIGSFQIYQDEFEKTPKRSIKRFMYQ
jgi:long-chain acyl-CoA synthetase